MSRQSIVVLYVASLMNHSCVPNAFGHYVRPLDSDDGAEGMASLRQVFVASVDIKAGEEITAGYVNFDMCTIARNQMLRESKLFTCTCRRCKDPGELGLHTGAPCCPHCKGEPRIWGG